LTTGEFAVTTCSALDLDLISNRIRSLIKSVSEFETCPRSELRIMRPNAGIKGFTRGGDCDSRFDSPAAEYCPRTSPVEGLTDFATLDQLIHPPLIQ
jgi:hypothetical protein